MKESFTPGDHVVCPAHGVGVVRSIEDKEIADEQLTLLVIHFSKDRLVLRVPLGKTERIGLRFLSSKEDIETAIETLTTKITSSRKVMWSRRAQGYENKINSGDPISLAEVIRDLYKEGGQDEQSYSERKLYQAALGRFASEYALLEKIDEDSAIKSLEDLLHKKAA